MIVKFNIFRCLYEGPYPQVLNNNTVIINEKEKLLEMHAIPENNPHYSKASAEESMLYKKLTKLNKL